MFGIGSTELIIILVIALLVLGPSKLPQMARSLGKGLAEFRRVSTDVKRTIEEEAERADEEVNKKTAQKAVKKKSKEPKTSAENKTKQSSSAQDSKDSKTAQATDTEKKA